MGFENEGIYIGRVYRMRKEGGNDLIFEESRI